MRAYRKALVVVVSGILSVGWAENAQAQSAACISFTGSIVDGFSNGPGFGNGFLPGEVLTVNINGGGGLVLGLIDNVLGQVVPTGNVGFTYTVPANTSGDLFFTGNAGGVGGLATWSCAPGGVKGAPTSQQVNNARTAVINGQQVMRSFNDWIQSGVVGSFGLIGGNGQAAAPQAPSAAQRLAALGREERALREEQSLRPHDAALARRLEEVRRDIQLARADATIAAAGVTQLDSAVHVSALVEDRDARRNAAPPTTFSFATRDLLGAGGADLAQAGAAAPSPRWNVWGEGRIVGAWDSLANSRARGLMGAAGVDYKLTPWMTAGISLGIENFNTRFRATGQQLDTIGVSAVPYVGFRIADNVYASAFVGLTHISYDGVPIPGTTADFSALRIFFGGSVSGNWRSGNWGLRPTLTGAWGFENQRAYTDSAGTAVGSQTVRYGRVAVGPDIGYTFSASDGSWTVEPFVIARAQLDFASSNATALGGQTVLLRSGVVGSGQAGLGINASFASGFYLRAQVTYDSLFVDGLDLVSGSIRGGMRF
jgi:hypothetical protein